MPVSMVSKRRYRLSAPTLKVERRSCFYVYANSVSIESGRRIIVFGRRSRHCAEEGNAVAVMTDIVAAVGFTTLLKRLLMTHGGFD